MQSIAIEIASRLIISPKKQHIYDTFRDVTSQPANKLLHCESIHYHIAEQLHHIQQRERMREGYDCFISKRFLFARDDEISWSFYK